MGVGRWDSFITTSLQLLLNVQVSLMSQILAHTNGQFWLIFFESFYYYYLFIFKVVAGESMF